MAFIFQVAQNGITDTSRFLGNRLDHGKKRLHDLELFVLKYVHRYSDNDHKIPRSVEQNMSLWKHALGK
jgi:hypothetical protein